MKNTRCEFKNAKRKPKIKYFNFCFIFYQKWKDITESFFAISVKVPTLIVPQEPQH